MKKTILIAETNFCQENLIKAFFKRNNIEANVFNTIINNSKDVIKRIEELQPDIVITNERKKGDLSGTDIIQKVQKNKNNFQPIFIIISAFNDLKDICKKKEITTYYIKKPFNFDYLIKTIEKIALNEGDNYCECYNYGKKG